MEDYRLHTTVLANKEPNFYAEVTGSIGGKEESGRKQLLLPRTEGLEKTVETIYHGKRDVAMKWEKGTQNEVIKKSLAARTLC